MKHKDFDVSLVIKLKLERIDKVCGVEVGTFIKVLGRPVFTLSSLI